MTPAALPAARPNVILVMTDDQGFGDVGVHGNPSIKTPNLDRFAREGVELTRFYSNPVCSPTRASLMTGRYYYRTGVLHTYRGGALMHGDEVTVAELLGRGGYRTGIFGKWHLGDNYPMRPQDQGFQECLVHRSGGISQPPDTAVGYFDPDLWHNGRRIQAKGYCTDVFFDAASRFIEENRSRPFFVYLTPNAPHDPLQVDPRYSGPYRQMGLDDATAKVYGMVQNIDENFGRLLERLEKLGLRRETLVIFMTDNGPQRERFNSGMRGRKATPYQGGIRVPFFLQWPARIEGRREVDRVAAHIDVLPTLLEACGARVPAQLELDGVSLLPLLTGAVAPQAWPDRTLYFQVHRGLEPKRYQNASAVTQRHTLVAYPDTFNRDDLTTSPEHPVLELYELQPGAVESRNLAAERPDLVETLRRGYDDWFSAMQRTRAFRPGVIHIGSAREDPTTLCVVQDAAWRKEQPIGWQVHVERSGRYRIAVRRAAALGPGRVVVRWQGAEQSLALAADASSAVASLGAGRGMLEIRFVPDAGPAALEAADASRGDVELHYLSRR
jgi:arylsulfatase A-like enzyme